jgi:hypothetical protein
MPISLEQLREIKGTIEGQNQAFEDLITNAKDLTEKSKNINDALGLGVMRQKVFRILCLKWV